MEHDQIKKLLSFAEEARARSYSPYSGISVGCALLCRDGRIFCGANIENSAFSPSVCAERVAFSSAVYEGERDFVAIAVVGGKNGVSATDPFPPCGVCRQTMREFCRDDFQIILSRGEEYTVHTLNELLPLGFGKEHF